MSEVYERRLINEQIGLLLERHCKKGMSYPEFIAIIDAEFEKAMFPRTSLEVVWLRNVIADCLLDSQGERISSEGSQHYVEYVLSLFRDYKGSSNETGCKLEDVENNDKKGGTERLYLGEILSTKIDHPGVFQSIWDSIGFEERKKIFFVHSAWYPETVEEESAHAITFEDAAARLDSSLAKAKERFLNGTLGE